MTNGSSVTPQHDLNDRLASTKNNTAPLGDSFNTITSFLNALGLPGNVLVVAVYIRQITTSTRVYIFALVVADSVVCVCTYLALSKCVTDLVTRLAFSYIINASLTCSMFLLVFVSFERLVAVKRPHTFSMDPQRVKKIQLSLLWLQRYSEQWRMWRRI